MTTATLSRREFLGSAAALAAAAVTGAMTAPVPTAVSAPAGPRWFEYLTPWSWVRVPGGMMPFLDWVDEAPEPLLHVLHAAIELGDRMITRRLRGRFTELSDSASWARVFAIVERYARRFVFGLGLPPDFVTWVRAGAFRAWVERCPSW